MNHKFLLHSIAVCTVLTCTFLVVICLSACVSEDEYPSTPAGNFEALWKIMDERYCFFNEKNVDWDEVYTRYAKQIDNSMTEEQLFEVLTNMLSELRDGHVNLYSSFDVGRNWSWQENYPSNYSDTLESKYLGTDYKIAAGLRYKILDDNVGFIRYSSFSDAVGEGNLDEVLLDLAPCRALIIDIRDNSGGQLTYAERLAARFTNEEILVGYMRHKTGRGHSDFSDLEEQHLQPSSGIRWQKNVMLLTNRQVYSAANEFVKYMKCCPRVTVVGDQTGGGAGLPFSSELPNGWSVRFSACPMYDCDGNSTEFGIAPHHTVMLTASDMARGVDTIIEYARNLVK